MFNRASLAIFLSFTSSWLYADPVELICEGAELYSVDVAKAYGFEKESRQRSVRLEFKFDEEKAKIWMRGHPRSGGKPDDWTEARKVQIEQDYIDAEFPLSFKKNFKLSNLMQGNTGIGSSYRGRLDRVTGNWSTKRTQLSCTRRQQRLF